MSVIDLDEYEKRKGPIREADWNKHISFSFTVVRAKRYIEARCFDNSNSLEMVMSVSALFKGRFYSSKDIFSKTYELAKYFWEEDLFQIKSNANKYGLYSRWKDYSILELAQKLYGLAAAWLEGGILHLRTMFLVASRKIYF